MLKWIDLLKKVLMLKPNQVLVKLLINYLVNLNLLVKEKLMIIKLVYKLNKIKIYIKINLKIQKIHFYHYL